MGTPFVPDIIVSFTTTCGFVIQEEVIISLDFFRNERRNQYLLDGPSDGTSSSTGFSNRQVKADDAVNW